MGISIRVWKAGLLIPAVFCGLTLFSSEAIVARGAGLVAPQAPTISKIDLKAEKVSIEWDASGRVLTIYSSASAPVPSNAAEVQAAESTAGAMATAQLMRFLEQRTTAAQLSSAVADAVRQSGGAPIPERDSLVQQVIAYKDWFARQPTKPRPGLVRRPSGNQLVVLAGFRIAAGKPGPDPAAVLGGVVGGLPAPPPSPDEAAKLKAEGKLQEPTIVKRVPPVYPPIASAARVSGEVGVEVTIGTDGRVKDAKIVKSIPLLDQAALDAVKQWEFTPLILHGKPAATVMRVTVTFTLKEPAPNS